MLDKKMKYILNHLSTKEKENGYYFSSTKDLIIPSIGLHDEYLVNQAIDKLIDYGFVIYGDADSDFLYANRNEIRLVHDGRNYKEHRCLAKKNFIIKSIVVPIGISILTSVITYFVMRALAQC